MIGIPIANAIMRIFFFVASVSFSYCLFDTITNELPIILMPAIEELWPIEFFRLDATFGTFDEFVTETLPVIMTEPDRTDNIPISSTDIPLNSLIFVWTVNNWFVFISVIDISNLI